MEQIDTPTSQDLIGSRKRDLRSTCYRKTGKLYSKKALFCESRIGLEHYHSPTHGGE